MIVIDGAILSFIHLNSTGDLSTALFIITNPYPYKIRLIITENMPNLVYNFVQSLDDYRGQTRDGQEHR